MSRARPAILRLFDRVRFDAITGCWIFTGPLDDGYARISVGRRMVRAHRLSFEFFIGPIPAGRQPDHLCRDRACFNPWHLELVTQKVNVLRGVGPPAQNARKTHCIRGHELPQSSDRRCPPCGVERKRRWHEQKGRVRMAQRYRERNADVREQRRAHHMKNREQINAARREAYACRKHA